MVISFLELGNYGRLGNQMFQYALLKSISVNNNLCFKIPTIQCDIKKLNITANIMSRQECRAINIKYKEKFFHFDEDVFSCNDNTSFEGYFQSYKYFDKIKDIIVEEFSVNINIQRIADEYINSIKGADGIVSIHVRRGDYLNFPNIHPTSTLEYYNKCIQYFDNIGKYNYIVFSDDILWCKQNLKHKNIHYSENKDNVLDLCIMSKCNHNIITNSSFSWWAAYLNKNKNKIIKCPKEWFGKDGNQDYYDLIPKTWDIL